MKRKLLVGRVWDTDGLQAKLKLPYSTILHTDGLQAKLKLPYSTILHTDGLQAKLKLPYSTILHTDRNSSPHYTISKLLKLYNKKLDCQVYFAFINLFLCLCTKTTHFHRNLAMYFQIICKVM